MPKALIISEKPSVAKDIVAALGGFEEKKKGDYYESDEYVCTYAVGHILSLLSPEDISPQFKRWRLQDLPIIPDEFKMKPVPRQESRLKVIVNLMKRKDIDVLINACDAAREGELIFRELVQYAQVEKPIQRLWLQSMTKKAIQDGFSKLQPGENYQGLASAASCRANADWVIGMNATRALTVRLKSRNQRGVSWSAGRVQTPTLGLLVDRELEVLEHVAEPYWRVKVNFSNQSHPYEGIWFNPEFDKKSATRDQKEDRIFSKEKALEIQKQIEGRAPLASEVRKPSPRKPPQLFDLTSLQRAANSRFSWSASRTLKAAQRCYETHKVLTYPRTSSKFLPEDYREEVDKILETFSQTENFGVHAKKLIKDGLLNDDKIFNDAGVTDHFAIIPTGEIKSLEGDDAKIFDLVSRQFMAAFYPPSVYEEVERITKVEGHSFRSKPPKVLKEAGWEAVFEKQVGDQAIAFPPLIAGQNKAEGVGVDLLASELEELETKPPSRISEAGLLSLMENAGRQVEDEELASVLNSAEGLGTAATRAEIIENLKAREYVDPDLRPTTKGIRLIDILHRIHASRLTSAELTARLELYLTEVEKGQRTVEEFMDEVAQTAKEVVEATRDFDYEEIYPNENPLGACPKCSGPVYEKAWFYGCEESTKRNGKKNCDFLIWKEHNGRYINPQVVRTLLSEKQTREIDGFRSASGKPYTAVLELEGSSLVRKNVNEDESAIEGYEVNEEPLGACPLECAPSCKVVETPTEFICSEKLEAKEQGDRGASGFSFPRTLCKREIKREDLIHYLEHGETPMISDFISKRGRKFSAKLVMENDGVGFRFEFPARVSKKKKEEQEASENSVEQASEENTLESSQPVVETEKTTTKKASTKKATAKASTKKASKPKKKADELSDTAPWE